jgi:hypothetical protein
MMNPSFRNNSKGQVIVITALLIGLLMFSTFVYVTEVIKKAPAIETNQNELFPQYQQNLKNTLISALANITSDNNTQVLNQDIDKLNQIFSSHFYGSLIQINYTLANTAPYQDGLWISSGQENHTTVGAQVSYQLFSVGKSETSTVVGNVVVASEVYLYGNSSQIDQATKQGNLTLQVFNEGVSALVSNFSCYYQDGAQWVRIENFSSTDFGTGTYEIVFSVQLSQPSDPLTVAIYVLDQRGISLRVQATCQSS